MNQKSMDQIDKFTSIDVDDNVIGSYCYSYDGRCRSRFALGDHVKTKADEIYVISSIFNSIPDGNFYYHIRDPKGSDTVVPGRFREKNWDGTEGPASEWTLISENDIPAKRKDIDIRNGTD